MVSTSGMRLATCGFTEELKRHLLRPDGFNAPYLYLLDSDLKDGIVCFRVPGYTAGHLVISEPDSLSLSSLSGFRIERVVLYPRQGFNAFAPSLAEDVLSSFEGSVQSLADLA